MNIETKEFFKKFFGSEIANRMEAYAKKMETATILYCETHDREFASFEDGCPGCLRDKQEEA